ncbi:MAG: hypothetical protein QOK04_1784, partial [Solirubrobacteraceae bacterium]|nr:hypothetical protein [Solirubrobacteraceae bacterium]
MLERRAAEAARIQAQDAVSIRKLNAEQRDRLGPSKRAFAVVLQRVRTDERPAELSGAHRAAR